jgi:hypothetical protein
MASFFASRTLYKVVTIFELLFSIVIIAFAAKTIKLSLDKANDGWNDRPFILYSAALALILGTLQILAAVLLITLTRGPHSFDKDDYVIGFTPKFWLLQAVISFGLLIFIFVAPVAQYNLPNEQPEMKVTLKELYTYVIVNALFKIIFIWMVYTTIRFRRNK